MFTKVHREQGEEEQENEKGGSYGGSEIGNCG